MKRNRSQYLEAVVINFVLLLIGLSVHFFHEQIAQVIRLLTE